VWFVQEDDKVFLLPVGGSDSNWYKNLVKTPTIGVAAGGAAFRTNAKPIEDAASVGEVADRFRARYGDRAADYYPKLDAAVEVPLT
jgi:hypothetical protein